MIRATTRSEQAPAGERGVVVVYAAVAMVTLLSITAVVVDLAAARSDRASNQVTADAAAAAGAVTLSGADGVAACQAALGYLVAHVDSSLVGADCTSLPTVCDAATTPVATTATGGGLTVTITHPVDDTSVLMDPGGIGTGTQSVTVGDGDRCERIGVAIEELRATFFARLLDRDSLTTSIHSVARAEAGSGQPRVLNLLILERHECDALTMAGSGGGSGGIALSPMFDPVTGEHLPGLAAVDSDGTVGCGSDGTIDVDGAGSVIRADGQPGCADELPPAGSGNGCGQIRTYAPGPPGCVVPACSSSGTVAPAPGRMGVRLTRAPVDWRYNCAASYPVAWDIRGCPDAATTPSYIAQLLAAVGASGVPSGFSSYTAAGHPCTVDGPPGTSVTIPEGNWVVDCDLSVKRTLVFEGGNVVFDGDVALTSAGDLRLNVANTSSFSWSPGQAVDHRDHSAAAAWAYLRDGTLTKAGNASFTLERTLLHLSASSTVAMTGGDGSVRWIAPDAGPFEDLAMWSDGTADHGFAGQAGLNLEGVFFAPYARITYSGNGSQKQVAAQFISEKLAVSGNGLLLIEPRYDRAIRFPQFPVVELIR